MDILTYSVHGLVPDAISQRNSMLHEDLYIGKTLIAFVKSFAPAARLATAHHVVLNCDLEEIQANPNVLYFDHSVTNGGIKSDVYKGWCQSGHTVARVTVNTYDPKTTKVYIRQESGTYLEPVPEFVHIRGIPGLYQIKKT